MAGGSCSCQLKLHTMYVGADAKPGSYSLQEGEHTTDRPFQENGAVVVTRINGQDRQLVRCEECEHNRGAFQRLGCHFPFS